MKKTLILAAAFACAAFSANAAILVDNWTPAGGAWSASQQPGFSGGNGTVNADAGSNGGATLTVSGAYANSLYQDSFFYTLFTTPTLTFSVDSASSFMTSIVLEIKASNQQTPALTFSNGSAFEGSYDLVVGETVLVPSPMGDQPATVFTYTWDVAGYDFSNGFDIVFTTGIHNAFFEISLSQEVIPEPSTYALIAGAFGLAAVVVARRRRA